MITAVAPVDQSPAMQTMFRALRAIKPELPQPQRSVTTVPEFCTSMVKRSAADKVNGKTVKVRAL